MLDEQTLPEPLAPETPPVEMVEITDSTKEDRQAFLERAAIEEFGTDEPSDEPVVQQTPSEVKTPVEAKPQVEVPAPQNMPPQADEVHKQLLEENERLKKSTEQKELFIQRRNSEFGELKKQLGSTRNELVEAKRRLQDGLDTKYQESPVLALEDRDQIKEIDSSLKKLDNDEQRLQRIYDGERLFQQHVDVSKVSIDDLAETLRADGVSDQFIAQLKTNPYEFTTPEALVQLGKRAMERKAYAQDKADLKTVAIYAKSLEKENAQLKAKPGQVLSNVQRHLNQSPPFTSANGSSAEDNKPFKEPHLMSRAERAEFLKNNP